jgi:hypothetical protein
MIKVIVIFVDIQLIMIKYIYLDQKQIVKIGEDG